MTARGYGRPPRSCVRPWHPCATCRPPEAHARWAPRRPAGRRLGQLRPAGRLDLGRRAHLEHLHRRGHPEDAFGPLPGGERSQDRRAARIQRRVARRDEGEQRRDGAGRVQVVVQRPASSARAGRRPGQRGASSAPAARVQPVLKLAQPARAFARAASASSRQIELLPVVRLKHQQPHGARDRRRPPADRVRSVMLPKRFDILSPRILRNSPWSQYAGELRRARCTRSSGRSRPRGAGRSGPRRRHGCRARRCPAGGGCSSSAIAEHSMCQPGRPRPKGASQAAPTASSSGRAAFQSTKSRASSLAYSSALTRSLAPAP